MTKQLLADSDPYATSPYLGLFAVTIVFMWLGGVAFGIAYMMHNEPAPLTPPTAEAIVTSEFACMRNAGGDYVLKVYAP